jgi:hypothetical protein
MAWPKIGGEGGVEFVPATPKLGARQKPSYLGRTLLPGGVPDKILSQEAGPALGAELVPLPSLKAKNISKNVPNPGLLKRI